MHKEVKNIEVLFFLIQEADKFFVLIRKNKKSLIRYSCRKTILKYGPSNTIDRLLNFQVLRKNE